MTYAPAKFEIIMSNHLQETTLFGLDLGPRAHEMLPNTLYILKELNLNIPKQHPTSGTSQSMD